MNWYYSDGETRLGPIPEEQLIELRRAGKVTATTWVWHEGMANWAPYGEAGPAVNVGAPPVMSAAGNEAVCVECGKIFPREEMIAHGQTYVCAGCKPVFMQKLAEGARIGIPGRTTPWRYAGFWIRVGAKIIDGLIIGLVFFLPLVVIFAVRASAHPNQPTESPAVMILSEFFYILALSAYETFFIGKYGATPGKMACRIRVVVADGTKVSYPRAAGRFFANMLSGLICYIGYIIAGFDDQKRALHDHICNTRVIYKD